MRKLLLFFAMLCVSIGAWAEVTSYTFTNGSLSIDSETGVATVTSTQSHAFSNWFTGLGESTDPTQAAVIGAMNGITKMVYSSGSVFGSADFNDVLNSFPTVVTVDATGFKFYSTSGNLNINGLTYVKTLIMESATHADGTYPTVTMSGNPKLESLSLKNAFIDFSSNQESVKQLTVTNNPKLSAIDMTGATVGGNYGYAGMDFSGNTSLTELDLSGVSIRPNSNNLKSIDLTGTTLTDITLPNGVSSAVVTNMPELAYETSNNCDDIAVTIALSGSEGGNLAEAIAKAKKMFASQNTLRHVKITGVINESDLAALKDFNFTNGESLDLSKVTLNPASLATSADFSFVDNEKTNTNLKTVILPKNIPAIKESWFSTVSDLHAAITYDNNTDVKLQAYLKTPNTLAESIMRLAYDKCTTTGPEQFDNDLGSIHRPEGVQGSPITVSKVKYVKISGSVAARDFNGSTSTNIFDSDGHIVFDKEADETSDVADAAIGGGTRTMQGTQQLGALTGASLVSLDLGDAIIEEDNYSDLSLTKSGVIGSTTYEVVIPTYSGLKTIPADFLNISSNVYQICIPGNIENIKTRAFKSAPLMHVWTSGTDETIVYDNGAVTAVDSDGKETIVKGQMAYGSKPLYGTYTLPANLKLIESRAFSNTEPHVKDVYVLAINAPECHVDAFNTVMYCANNAYDRTAIKDGIITRDAYINSKSAYTWMTMLHYPRECTTPAIQQYTDPTRDYSIATGLKDGKGATIYFPNQCEYLRAYTQGTAGYVWNAWSPARKDDGSNYIAYSEGGVNNAWSLDVQEAANLLYKSNTNKNPSKTDRSFYDVTANGELIQPAGLQNYYDVTWEGTKLYPKAETVVVTDESGNPVYKTVEVYDDNGNPVYVPADAGATYEGNYVKYETQEYVEEEGGAYYHPIVNRNHQDQSPRTFYSRTEEWVAADDGDYVLPGGFSNPGWYTTYAEFETWQNKPSTAVRVKKRIVYKADSNGGYEVSSSFAEWNSSVTDCIEGINGERYNLKTVDAYRAATSGDSGPFYKVKTEEVEVLNVTDANDYRGWHQFVLTAYATNSNEDFVPYRSYISDNDWWTICLPFDLTYKEMIYLFGTTGSSPKIPYLSKLTYVVRDVENSKIRLMFSKNLMEYKETVADGAVHGTISETKARPADNDVVLHKGVPYLIRPNMSKDASGSFKRQFDIKANEYPGLGAKIKASENLTGSIQKQLVYSGEYTVPAYVVNNTGTAQEAVETSAKEFEMGDGTKFTHPATGTISYAGENTSYELSSEFTYTFVGSFYKSLMPQYCYFLGWDSNKNCAAFWYNRVPDVKNYNWNNETGIICPKWNKNLRISDATGIDNPARWIISAGTDLKNDDFNKVSGAKHSLMDIYFGDNANMDIVVNGIGEITVKGLNSNTEDNNSVYDMQGIRVNKPLNQLPKGVYIKNGKKYIVK
jgi:hypothetical protein